MSRALFRPAGPGDLEAVAGLWHTAFGDPLPLVRRLLGPGGLLALATVAELEGQPVSAMFAFPGLRLGNRSAAYLYALCTRPDCRSRGLGAGVLAALRDRCFAQGTETVFLSPAGEGLAQWYQQLGFAPLFGLSDRPLSPEPGPTGSCVPISPAAYLRERVGGCVLSPALLETQSAFLDAEGGGLLRLELSGGTGLACALPTPGGLRVLELQCAPTLEPEALRTLAAHFGADGLLLRGPGRDIPLLCAVRDGEAPVLPPDFCFPFVMD